MGYLEKAEEEGSFFFAGLMGYREKAEVDDSFFLTCLMGYLEKSFFAGLLSGPAWTGNLSWNC